MKIFVVGARVRVLNPNEPNSRKMYTFIIQMGNCIWLNQYRCNQLRRPFVKHLPGVHFEPCATITGCIEVYWALLSRKPAGNELRSKNTQGLLVRVNAVLNSRDARLCVKAIQGLWIWLNRRPFRHISSENVWFLSQSVVVVIYHFPNPGSLTSQRHLFDMMKIYRRMKNEFLQRSCAERFDFVRSKIFFFMRIAGCNISDPNFKIRFATYITGFCILDVNVCFFYTVFKYRKDYFKCLSAVSTLGAIVPVSYAFDWQNFIKYWNIFSLPADYAFRIRPWKV